MQEALTRSVRGMWDAPYIHLYYDVQEYLDEIWSHDDHHHDQSRTCGELTFLGGRVKNHKELCNMERSRRWSLLLLLILIAVGFGIFTGEQIVNAQEEALPQVLITNVDIWDGTSDYVAKGIDVLVDVSPTQPGETDLKENPRRQAGGHGRQTEQPCASSRARSRRGGWDHD